MHGIVDGADSEPAFEREPGVAQAPEAAHAHRFDRAPLALHERIQVRNLRQQDVVRLSVVERAQTVDRLRRARGDAAPAALLLDERRTAARGHAQRLVAGQTLQCRGPAVARDDDAAAGLDHEPRGPRRVGGDEHGLAVRPRFDDFGCEADPRAADGDGARVREERRPIALVGLVEHDDVRAAGAHLLLRVRIVSGGQHVRASARDAVDAVTLEIRARHDVGGEPDDARSRTRHRTVQLGDQHRFGLGRAQDHARVRHRRRDGRQPRCRLVVEQRHEQPALGDVGQRPHGGRQPSRSHSRNAS